MHRSLYSLVSLAVAIAALVGLVGSVAAQRGARTPSELAEACRRSGRTEPGQAVAAEAMPLTVRASVSTHGKEANGGALGAVLSANGRYVAFASRATTLVSSDRNRVSDIFVRDLRRGKTIRVSVSSAGAESNGESLKPSISADGHVVAFPSSATNLVGGDRNGLQDIFVGDWSSRTTRRVSIGEEGESNGSSLAAIVSGDGKVIVFSSNGTNLVPGIETECWTSSSLS